MHKICRNANKMFQPYFLSWMNDIFLGPFWLSVKNISFFVISHIFSYKQWFGNEIETRNSFLWNIFLGYCYCISRFFYLVFKERWIFLFGDKRRNFLYRMLDQEMCDISCELDASKIYLFISIFWQNYRKLVQLTFAWKEIPV